LHIIDEEAGLSVIKQQINLDPKVHSLSVKSPLKLKFESDIKQLKNTSVAFGVKLISETTDELLGENFIKVVRFNKQTRRSIPFPEWYHKKYSSAMGVPGYPGTEKEDLPKIPENAFEYITSATYSDEDMNGHVNQSSYIRFCMDAATRASLSGHYDHYTKDMCLYPSLQWTISYVGESHANDQLNIFTWQEKNCPEHIFFTMLINGKKTIFHAATTFGEDVKETRFFHKL
jgi:acyl-CoA thioesterase FadM